jgi:hypothetical protein
MNIWTTAFWKDAAERAVATVAQAGVAAIAVDVATPIWRFDWMHIAGISITASVLYVGKSLGAGASNGTPSVGDVEVHKAPRPRDPVEDDLQY